MSDLLKEMIYLVGIEFLSSSINRENDQEIPKLEACEKKLFPDFDHITVI